MDYSLLLVVETITSEDKQSKNHFTSRNSCPAEKNEENDEKLRNSSINEKIENKKRGVV